MHEFKARQAWSNGQAYFTVISEDGSQHEMRLSGGEARALVRASLRCLGYTQVERVERGKRAWKDKQVEKLIAPLLTIINALMPKVNNADELREIVSDIPIGDLAAPPVTEVPTATSAEDVL